MKIVSALVLALNIAAPALASDFASLQSMRVSAISKVNPFPDPSNPESCYLTGLKDGLCNFKCLSGKTFQIKPVKPQAASVYEQCGGGDYRAGQNTAPDRADLQWKGVSLKAADGTAIRVDYNLLSLGGTMLANPLWITVNNPAFRGGEKVRAALMTFYKATASSADSLKETKEFDLVYNGVAFQAKGPAAMVYESHHAWTHHYRQELAVSVNGSWLTDPWNGSHNFKFELGK